VIFDADQSAGPLLDTLLVDFERLDDDNAALHFPLDHVDFRVTPASEWCQSVEHYVSLYEDLLQASDHAIA
jgi:hypothetical protein